MTDLSAAWHPDPTGRHDHRYWDGTRWTDHVADAGVAASDAFGPADAATAGPPGSAPATDPVTEPVAEPVAEAEAEAPGEADEPTAAQPATEVLSWSPPAVTRPTPVARPEPPAEPEREPEATAEREPTPDSEPTPEPEPAPTAEVRPAVGPERHFPTPTPTPTPAPSTPWSPSTPSGPSLPSSPTPSPVAPAWGSPRPPESTPAAGADEPTLVTPAPAASADVTQQVPQVAPRPTAEPAPLPAPEPVAGEGGGGNRTRNVLVAVAVLVVVALVAFFAIKGSDDDDSETAIAARMAETFTSGAGSLTKQQADCVSKAVVHEVGAGRLKDVDFGSETVQSGALGSDLQSAVVKAYTTCKVTPAVTADPFAGGTSGTTSGGDKGSSDTVDTLPGGSSDLGALGNIDDFKKLLADQYESTLHLSHDKATCLADAMADAVKDGKLDQESAFGDFFDYLDKCGVSLDEITKATGDTTPTTAG